jgi:hypothetical protein
VSKNQIASRREYDKNVFLAPPLPASSGDGTRLQAGMWEVADEFVDELLGKRFHCGRVRGAIRRVLSVACGDGSDAIHT